MILLIALALLSVGSDAAASPSAAARGGRHVQITAEGVQLSLVIPRRDYPRNALVRLTVRITNRSQADLMVQDSCGDSGLSLQVERDDGSVAFPPAILPPPLGDAACKLPPDGQVLPGGSMSVRAYAVLRARHLRAVADVVLVGSAGRTATPLHLQTPAVLLALHREKAPSITIVTAHGVHAIVAPGSTTARPGRPLYTGWYRCPQPNGTTTIAGQTFYEEVSGAGPTVLIGRVLNWVSARSNVLRPGCSHPIEWHLAVAWLKHPAVTEEYHPSA